MKRGSYGRRVFLGLAGLVVFGLAVVFIREQLFRERELADPRPVNLSMPPLPSPVLLRATGEIKKELGEVTRGLTGTYGIYVGNLTDGVSYGVSADRVFPAASLIKVPVMVAAYQMAEQGGLDLDEKYYLKDGDRVAGSGSLVGAKTGTAITYRQLLNLAGKQSDNTAFKIILAKVGQERVDKVLKEAGMEKTSAREFETTPREMGLLFERLYAGGVVNSRNKEEILSFLTGTIFEDRIPAGIPKGVRVAHKVGTDAGVFSDGGIVFGKRPFVLVVMTEGADRDEARQATTKIAGMVWTFEEF